MSICTPRPEESCATELGGAVLASTLQGLTRRSERGPSTRNLHGLESRRGRSTSRVCAAPSSRRGENSKWGPDRQVDTVPPDVKPTQVMDTELLSRRHGWRAMLGQPRPSRSRADGSEPCAESAKWVGPTCGARLSRRSVQFKYDGGQRLSKPKLRQARAWRGRRRGGRRGRRGTTNTKMWRGGHGCRQRSR